MGINISQYRSAIGCFCNFIKSKEFVLLNRIMRILISLIKYFGCLIVPIMSVFPYTLFALTILLLQCGDIESNPGPIRFCHLNARSLLSDIDINQHIQHQYSLLDEIYETLVYRSDFDVVAISETWLKDNVPDTELDLNGYQLPFCRHRGSRGGGVMIYVKDEIVAIERSDLNLPNIEMLWLEIKVQNKRIMFGTYYRAPGASAMVVDEFILCIDQTLDKVLNENPDMVILVGDFNDKCMSWDGDHSDSEMGFKFYNCINDRNLFQMVDEPTRITESCSSLLDLIITDSPGYIDNVSTLPPLSDLDHCIIYGTINFVDYTPSKIYKEVWLYNKADWDVINTVLDTAPWHMFVNNGSVDDILNLYYEMLYRVIDDFIPRREFIRRKKDKPWMNGYLRHIISLRNRMNGVYNKTLRADHKIIRNEMRNLAKREIKKAKAKYNEGLKNNLSDKNTNIKRFWAIMKQLYGAKMKTGIPTLLSGSDYYSTDIDKAEHFADYFADQCSLPDPPDGFALPPMHYLTNERLSNVYFGVAEVWDIMRKLDPGKASGPDKISYRFLKECAHTLARPFCLLFQRSLNDGIFPTIWKLSHISPVYKKLEKHFRENYRPVSLLSCISKVMERVVFNVMYAFFKKHGLLTERNSGFKENDSTVNQLIHICNNIYKGLDLSKDVCLVFLDVSKAFDKVYHRGLMYKLEQMGISGNLLKWIESYLNGRSQKVVINGVESNPRYINASVPQGSILGPLLFLVYVNDLVNDLETTPYLFADDTSLLEVINPRNVAGSFAKINRDLDSLSNWASQWRVNYNATKTVYMIVSNKKNTIVYPDLYLNGQVLTKVTSHKHLGITITKDMSWNLHIDAIIKKAASRLSGIRRIRFFITRKARVSLYNALVLPILEYGGVIFDNCTLYLKQRMESLQRRAAVICTCAFRNTSYERLLGELGWNTLDQRRKLARMSLFYKMNHKLCDEDDQCTDCGNKVGVPDYLKNLVPKKVGERTDYYLRNANDLTTVKTKKVKVYNSFVPKTVREWNNLEAYRYAPSLSSFRASYKKGMLRSPNPLHLLTMKRQWTYGPTLLPWFDHFHTSLACFTPL